MIVVLSRDRCPPISYQYGSIHVLRFPSRRLRIPCLVFRSVDCGILALLFKPVRLQTSAVSRHISEVHLPEGTMITIKRTIMPTMIQILIFMSFHHICFLTLFAPLRKPCADTARLSVLSCNASRRSPRCETLFMLSLITPTVSSIC